MGKNKKNSSKRNKHTNPEVVEDSKVFHNGTDKKKSGSKSEATSAQSLVPTNKNRSQNQQGKSRSANAEKKSSSKCWVVLVVFSVAVAVSGVMFREQIQEIAGDIFKHYIHPQVLVVQSMLESSKGEIQEPSGTIPSPSKTAEYNDDDHGVDHETVKQRGVRESMLSASKVPVGGTERVEEREDVTVKHTEASKVKDSVENESDENGNIKKGSKDSQKREEKDGDVNVDSDAAKPVEELPEGEIMGQSEDQPVIQGINVKVSPGPHQETSEDNELKAADKLKDGLPNAPAKENKAPAEEIKTVPAEEKKTVPAEEIKTVPAEEKKTVPAEKKNTAPAEKKNTAPAEEKKTAPAEEKKTVPAEEKKTAPAEEKKTVPAEEKKTAPAEEKKIMPDEGKKTTSAEEKKTAPAEEKKTTSAEEKKTAPAGEKKTAPAEEKKTTSAEEKKTSAEEKKTASSGEKKTTSADEKKSVPSEEKRAPTKEKKTIDDTQETATKTSAVERNAYKHSSITNDADFKFYNELDEADGLLEKDSIEAAVQKYDEILKKHVSSPRAHYGKGLTLDKLGFKYKSNEYLEQAIDFLGRVLLLSDVPDELVKLAGRKLVDRQQFRGWGRDAVKTMKTLCERFPSDISLLNELGVSYLMIGNNERARDVFKQALKKDPNSGFAKVHLGFVVYSQDKDLEQTVQLLSEGISTGEPGTTDGRFYSRLGDALLRLGRESEARKYYKEGEAKGLFPSAWQRSLYNVEKLTGRPWWTPEQTGYQTYLQMLQDNWKTIREEGLAQLNTKTGSFLPEDENLRDTGDWKQFTLYQQGRKLTENCVKVPKTCELIDKIPDAKGCKRGQVKFSVMSPGIHVWPHVGPTNCRIRAHLGLVVPEGPVIRVVNETRTWKEGQFIIFDDSFEHEVWHEGSELRLVLIVDFWHPELTAKQKKMLSPI